MNIDPTYLDVLRKIYTRLKNCDITWVVTGSLGFALQNVPVTPHDIDLQTDEAGAYEIERLFSEYVSRNVVFSSAEHIRSHFGALTIDGIKVEIMGDISKRLEDGTWEEPVELERYRQCVEVEGIADHFIENKKKRPLRDGKRLLRKRGISSENGLKNHESLSDPLLRGSHQNNIWRGWRGQGPWR